MRWVALAGLAALLSTVAAVGCGGPQQQCQDDSNCPAASRCEPEAHVCVERREDTTCSPACAEWEFCSETVCYDRYQAIAVLEPAAGTVDGGATVRAQLQSVAGWIPIRQHAGLEYRVSNGATVVNSGALSPVNDAGVYAGNISVAEGSYTLTAGFPGFPSDAPVSPGVAITVDTTVPTFTVDAGVRSFGSGPANEQDPQMSGAFKRNDVITVSITSSASDLDEDTVALTVQGIPSSAETTFPAIRGNCGPTTCYTATVDLATVQMLALRGQMSLVATGRDNAGNLGTGMATIPVTRFKWSRSVPGGSVTSSPAIGALGTIFVGTNGGTSGSVSAIKPDGTDQWSNPVSMNGPILASPAVGKGDGGAEVVYVIPSANPPTVYAVLSSDGGQAMEPVSVPTTGAPEASPLVANTTYLADTRESATTFLNSTLASVGTARFGIASPTTGAIGDAGTIAFPGNVVGDNNIAFAGDDIGRLREYQFAMSSSAWNESTSRTTIGVPKGLALTPTLIAGATNATVFSFGRSGGTTFTRPETNASIPVLLNGDLVYTEGQNSMAIRITPAGMGPGTPTNTRSVGGTTTSALVAKDQSIYFVRTSNSTLHVLAPDLTTLWSDSVEPAAVASSPNIDCARSSTGAKIPGPGTLYYGANNGKLYAIIVDNPGIDTTSPWPKYQHDPRNTGSLSTPLSDFTCP